MVRSEVEKREIPVNRVVIFALVRDGLIQLEQRTDPEDPYKGYFIIPGGKRRPGETIEDTLRREMLEEFGVTPLVYEFAGSINGPDTFGIQYERDVFVVTDWRGEISNPEGINRHIAVSIPEAKIIVTHPVSQRILDVITESLSTHIRRATMNA